MHIPLDKSRDWSAGSDYFAKKVFILLKAKFPTWIIYFTFKEWTFATTIFCAFIFYFLAYTLTLSHAKKKKHYFLHSEKVTEMFSLNRTSLVLFDMFISASKTMTRTEDFEFLTRISFYTIKGIDNHLWKNSLWQVWYCVFIVNLRREGSR